jgi:hypothetical protein
MIKCPECEVEGSDYCEGKLDAECPECKGKDEAAFHTKPTDISCYKE